MPDIVFQPKLRSAAWFDNPDNIGMTALYLERYLNFGLSMDELRSGRRIIGIAQTGSDLSPCNRHLVLAERLREGIRAAGGIAIEFPVHRRYYLPFDAALHSRKHDLLSALQLWGSGMRSYCGHAAALSRTASPPPDIVRDLQKDLKALGYHGGEISGVWGSWLDKGIAALRWDLTHPVAAPIVAAHNRNGAVVAAPAAGVTAIEPRFADVIAALCADAGVRQTPVSANAVGDNRSAWATVTAMRTGEAPTPFLAAIFKQESAGRHYSVPAAGNPDSFIILGLDHNDSAAPERITSRGYGIGQYTLFHHPPTAADLAGAIVDPAANVRTAFTALRGKFDTEVYSPKPGQGADDRMADHPLTSLRLCRYSASDRRYLSDCRACAAAVPKVNIRPGQPVFPGSHTAWAATPYYPGATYSAVPNRADFLCDWPYAVRRYNGAGINSYHYQARILLNLLS